MAKNTTQYVCSECGTVSPKWLGKCPSCGNWNTFVEEIIAPETATAKPTRPSANRPLPLSQIKHQTFARAKSGIEEFDTVLGGGIVPGSLVLLGGDPGIGKSTLLTQVAGNLSKTAKVLYASAEESASQVKMRCERLGVNSDNLLLLNETCLENIESHLDGMDYLIVDSIQAVYLDAMNSSAGSVGQVRECASRLQRIAKARGLTTFIVGHVTKDGNLAGPKVLEHVMDTVLYFEGEPQDNYKILRAVKNRFGSAQEVGVFEMRADGIHGVKDYAGIFVSETRGTSAGSVITPYVSGNRCVPVEIQSLVSKTPFGMPRRMPLGIDYNKLVLMIAVLEKRAGIPFYTQDVYVNAMGGIRLAEPSVDLALLLSLCSAERGTPLSGDVAVFGEVGLTGEVRGVTQAEKRVQECVRQGITKIILPRYNLKGLEKYKDKVNLCPVSFIRQAIKEAFGE